MSRKIAVQATLGVLVLALAALPANATVYVGTAFCITANDPGGSACDTLQAQILATYNDVTDVLKIENTGPNAGTVAGVYFRDPLSLLNGFGAFTFSSSSGVSFVGGGNPQSLPGGNAFGFPNPDPNRATHTAGNIDDGIDPGEWLAITLGSDNPVTFGASLLSDMSQIDTATLIGVHVQRLNGFSEGAIFLFGPEHEHVVPEAGTLALITSGAALLLVGRLKRRRSS